MGQVRAFAMCVAAQEALVHVDQARELAGRQAPPVRPALLGLRSHSLVPVRLAAMLAACASNVRGPALKGG
jgi:hypothetical protein